MYNNYIFDLDGTLINSSKEVLQCFEKAFSKAGYIIDKSRLTSGIIGPPLKEIIKLIAPDLDDKNIIENVIKHYRTIYDYEENDISELYDGVYDLLIRSKQQGKKLFIATFKPYKPTMRIVQQFKLDMFNDIYTIDRFGYNITKSEMIKNIMEKDELLKEETVMIGDAASDINAAKEAGITGIGVLWGYGENKSELIKNANNTVKNIVELEKCLKLSYQTI